MKPVDVQGISLAPRIAWAEEAVPCAELFQQCRDRFADDAQTAHACQIVAVAKLVCDDDILLSPQHQYRLTTAATVLRSVGGALGRLDYGRIDVERRDRLRLPAL